MVKTIKIKTIKAKEDKTTSQIQEAIIDDDKIQEAISALQVLGYNRKEIEKVFEKMDTANLSLEDMIRQGLSNLAK